MAVAALVLGIVGVAGGWIPAINYFTLVASILAIVFGVIARKNQPEKKGMATAGLILGIVGVALTVIGIICVCAGVAALGGALSSYY